MRGLSSHERIVVSWEGCRLMKGLSSHERVVVSFLVLTPPLFYVCRIPGSGFPAPYVVALCLCSMISGVRWVDSFVDISGIVDHHCLNFLLLCWHWWNCWPSLLNFLFIIIIIGLKAKRQYSFPLIFILPPELNASSFCGVRVTKILIFFQYFVNHCLFFCPYSFGHCSVCFFDVAWKDNILLG